METPPEESTFSFDFDNSELGPEDAETAQLGVQNIEENPTTSYFGFELEVPLLDSEGDYILPDEVLDEKTIGEGISTVGPCINSFKHAFTHFQARFKRIADIEMLSQYIHLRLVDLSNNRLQDVSALLPLTYLQVLNLESNRISDVAKLPPFKYLQALNLAQNHISDTRGFPSNKLAILSLAKNRLQKLEGMTGENFPNLLVLELRDNSLSTLRGLECPKLEELYVAGNNLTDLRGLENCPNLKTIHARHNSIDKLRNLATFKQLEYINLRNNNITDVSELRRLGRSTTLKTAIIVDNPIAGEETYREYAIAACPPSLRRLDKTIVSQLEQVKALGMRTKLTTADSTSIPSRSSSVHAKEPANKPYESLHTSEGDGSALSYPETEGQDSSAWPDPADDNYSDMGAGGM